MLQPLYNREEEPIEIPSNFQHPGIVLENKEHAAALYAALETLPENHIRLLCFTKCKAWIISR